MSLFLCYLHSPNKHTHQCPELNPLEGKLHKSLYETTAPDKMKASIWFRSVLKTIQRPISIHPA